MSISQPQGWDSWKNMTGGGGGGRSENLRKSFLEAVYVFFLGYEVNVMAVSGAVCAFD